MQLSPVANSPLLNWREAALAAAIFLVSLLLFWHSPVTQVGDSKYLLLLSENLLTKGSFMLDDHALSRRPKNFAPESFVDPKEYQVDMVDGHTYNYFPPGTAILSAPFVLVANWFGYSVVRQNHTYGKTREEAMQRSIASLLMAILAVLFYFTARLLLSRGWSVCLALGGVLGTQIWSTTSRAMWGHTWGVSLLGFTIWLLLLRETGRRKLSPVLLATVLSWSYFVRPTNSVFIVGITVYVLLFHRALFLRYAFTGAAWFMTFAAYSWYHFGKLLPRYYQANRLETNNLREALAGNLISPSRGLFIFVPVVLFIFWLLVRHWRRLPFPRLVWLALGVSVAQLVAVSCFNPWYGGWCYGPRYTSELVPWFLLLAVLGVRAALTGREEAAATRSGTVEWRTTLAVGAVLLGLSVLINAHGANSIEAAQWNERPASVDVQPWRVWNWQDLQILAGFVDPALPSEFPAMQGNRIFFGNNEGEKFLWVGWSGGEPEICWSERRRANLIFATGNTAANLLRLDFTPYLGEKVIHPQRLILRLNGRQLADFVLRQPHVHDFAFPLPPGVLQRKNELEFQLPDAFAPISVGGGSDGRLLGIALRSLELDGPMPPVPTAAKPPGS